MAKQQKPASPPPPSRRYSAFTAFEKVAVRWAWKNDPAHASQKDPSPGDRETLGLQLQSEGKLQETLEQYKQHLKTEWVTHRDLLRNPETEYPTSIIDLKNGPVYDAVSFELIERMKAFQPADSGYKGDIERMQAKDEETMIILSSPAGIRVLMETHAGQGAHGIPRPRSSSGHGKSGANAGSDSGSDVGGESAADRAARAAVREETGSSPGTSVNGSASSAKRRRPPGNMGL